MSSERSQVSFERQIGKALPRARVRYTSGTIGVIIVITVHVTTPFLHPFLFGTNFFPSHVSASF